MIGADSTFTEQNAAGVCSLGYTRLGRKPKFPLNQYNKARLEEEARLIKEKLEKNERLKELRDELEKNNKEIHCLEERIRKRKQQLDQLSVDEHEPLKKTQRVVRPSTASKLSRKSSDKLNLSSAQIYRRKKKTLATLRVVHCSQDTAKNDQKPVLDGLWTTLIGTATKTDLSNYISNSNVCMSDVVPGIVRTKIKQYESSESNKVRSIRTLYEGGLLSKTAYTTKRNSSDITKEDPVGKNTKNEFMSGCEIPKVLPYKKLMSVINSIDIGDVRDLESLATEWSMESVSGVYRPLQPFLLKLADFYLALDEKKTCLHWFDGKKGVFRVAVGADGAPFGKDNTETAYLVSFLNLLHRVQSCHDNHLILGADCEEDCAFLKKYTDYLRQEMENVEGKTLTTVKGNEVVFYFDLIPCDMKWASSMSGELSNAATYFSPFANVCQSNKDTVGGSIGGGEATWQPWKYSERIAVVKKVNEYKRTLTDPNQKQRSSVTKFIASNSSRQEFVPPLGKYVDKIMSEPLHNMNNAWQSWFMLLLSVALYCSNQAFLKSCNTFAFVPNTFPLIKMLECIKSTVKCGRLYKSYTRWFNEKKKAGIPFSYRFTGLESKRFSWEFSAPIKVLLETDNLTKGAYVKLHSLAFMATLLRDATSLYTRVDITSEQVNKLTSLCKLYFNCNRLLMVNSVSPTVWTVGYAIPFHVNKLYTSLGFGLGLNSMQGREAKHVKLKQYIQNTCNGRKNQQWWLVFRHEYVSLIWLREMDPLSIAYKGGQKKPSDSYIPKNVADKDSRYCYCGLLKDKEENNACKICGAEVMELIKNSMSDGEVSQEIKAYFTE